MYAPQLSANGKKFTHELWSGEAPKFRFDLTVGEAEDAGGEEADHEGDEEEEEEDIGAPPVLIHHVLRPRSSIPSEHTTLDDRLSPRPFRASPFTTKWDNCVPGTL